MPTWLKDTEVVSDLFLEQLQLPELPARGACGADLGRGGLFPHRLRDVVVPSNSEPEYPACAAVLARAYYPVENLWHYFVASLVEPPRTGITTRCKGKASRRESVCGPRRQQKRFKTVCNPRIYLKGHMNCRKAYHLVG